MKIMTVFGTRPEAIKMCPVVLELQQHSEIDTVVCLTGQHREMLNQVMEVFHIKAEYNLDVMQEGQTLASISSKVISLLDGVLVKEKPDMVLVHGDTTTSFVAALAAFYRHIPVGHVEAGLRTYNMQSPFPEEFNRQGVDLLSDLYFAPTDQAKEQLLREGKDATSVFVTGNTVIDALATTVTDAYKNELLDWVGADRLILLTAHRRENLGEPMRHIFRAVKRIVQACDDVKVIYPVHLNPVVQNIAREELADQPRIRLVDPLDVFAFHNFMKRSYLILTDSGGIQEEAPAMGKPVLVLRDTTERPEGIAAGTLKLVGTEEESIYREAMDLLNNEMAYDQMSQAKNPYGDGHASERIVQAIIDYLE